MNWRESLTEFANNERGRPLIWGETDCASLVIRAAEIIMRAPMAVDRGWRDEDQAELSAIHYHAPSVLASAGWQQIPLAHAGAGDIVIDWRRREPLPFLHIGVGSKWLSSDRAAGVVLVPRRMIFAHLSADAAAWRYAGDLA